MIEKDGREQKRIESGEKKDQMGYLFVIIIRSSQQKGDKI